MVLTGKYQFLFTVDFCQHLGDSKYSFIEKERAGRDALGVRENRISAHN
jgi:hypothetical protein